VDVAPRCYTVEMTGDGAKVNAFLQLLRPIGIKEVVRTGLVSIARGGNVGTQADKMPHQGRG